MKEEPHDDGADRLSPATGDWAVILVDPQGRIQNCSPRLLQLLDDPPDHLRGRPLRDLLPAIPIRARTPGYNCAFATFWRNRRGLRQRLNLQRNRQVEDLETMLCPIPGDHAAAQPMILVGLHFPRGLLERTTNLEGLRRYADTSAQSVMLTDGDGRITYVNPAFERMTGFSSAEVLGEPASLLKSGLHAPGFYEELWHALGDGKEFRAVFANRRKSGEIYFEEKCIRPFVDRDGARRSFIAIGSPVNEFLQSTFQRLEHLASHDPLTGLPNRHLFLDRLTQHCARAARNGSRFALAYIDLDGFKQINDGLGHAAGDRMLQATAQRLRQVLRDEDTVARLGGDEFGLIFGDLKAGNDLPGLLDKVLQALREGALLDDRTLPIAASIGVALYPDGGQDPESLMREADRVMYECKHAGGRSFRLCAPAGNAGNAGSDPAQP